MTTASHLQQSSLNPRHRPTVVIIDLDAIVENFRALRSLVERDAFFCPMIKANAYGHGDEQVARVLREAGAIHLGVATIEEGVGLRQAGDRGSILVFNGFFDRAGAKEMIGRDLTPVVSDWDQLEALETVVDRSVDIHLKFNTGMNRLGFAVEDAARLRARLERKSHLRLAGVCTHLLRGDDAAEEPGESRRQFKNLQRVLEAFAGLSFVVHAQNSAALAVLNRNPLPQGLYDRARFGPLGARPGIALYGAQGSDRPEFRVALRPALRWQSQVIAVNRVEAGETVSYGGRWRAARGSWIGVVPLGYGDGLIRSFSKGGMVLCRGSLVPVAGVICMDYFMIDMTEIIKPGEKPVRGDEVVLIGGQGDALLEADDLASAAGTISYEIFTRIGERVPRVFRRGGVDL